MKRYFYIFVIAIISIAGFFVFNNTHAQQQATFASAQAKACVTAITNSAQGEDYCNSQKKCLTNDLKTKLIPGEASLSAQNPCRDLIQEDIDAIVKIFKENGWLSDASAVEQSPCIDFVDVPLTACKSSAEKVVQVRNIDGVNKCCVVELKTDVKKAQEERQARERAAICGGGYDYPLGQGEGKTEIESVAGGLNINWPASPLGTSLSITETNGIAGLIKYIYDWLISLGGFAAFIALVIAGVQYLTSAGNPGKMSEAISRIRSAGIGLVLLLSSVLILNTINPRLINIGINFKDIPTSKMEELGVSPLGGANPCGTPCKGVYFCEGPGFTNCGTKIDVAEGQTKVGNLPKGVRSIDFDPNDQTGVGACSVILFQIEDQKFTDNYPPSSLIINPIRDLGGSFPMQSYSISDANRSSGFNLGF